MPFAIRIHQTGGPAVLAYEEIPMPRPAAGEVLVRQTAIGLNFIDVYHRSGLYPAPVPFTPGLEGAGIVEEVGTGVSLKKGTRVAYCKGPLGAYSEYRVMPAEDLISLPDSIDDQIAAALMLKGLTVHYLLRRTYPVTKGDIILVHAAAGGVGLLMCQWASHLGATVIGAVSSDANAAKAKENGCHHTILSTKENIAERVVELTGGAKCHVAYDSIGKDTFEVSLDSLRPLGMMVSFGQSSGPIPPLDTSILAKKGSLFLTRPTLFDYVRARADYESAAKEVFSLVEKGILNIHIGQTFALKDAAKAHEALQGRKTEGSTILLP